jgi:hypothetical protein
MKVIKKSMKYPSSEMEEDYRSMVDYLTEADSRFVYMKTSGGKNKRGLGIFKESESKHMRYVYINSPDEKRNDDGLDYVYIEERTFVTHVVRYETNPLKQLRQLHQITNFDYASAVYSAVKIAHTLKGITISTSALQYPYVFSDLGLATYVDKVFGQRIKFLENPPSLYIGNPPLAFP